MKTDMLGSDIQKEMLMSEDLCSSGGKVDCRCAEGALDFLGKEWGPPPTCLLNIKKAIYRPEVFAMLNECLPIAAKAVTSAPAGAPLSSNMSYLFDLIKRGEGYLQEATIQIGSFINQERVSCDLGQQLAEDHLAHLSLLLEEANAHLSKGLERAGFAAPGQKTVIHQQVGNHCVYMVTPPDGMDILKMNRIKCMHNNKLVDCRMSDHNKIGRAHV